MLTVHVKEPSSPAKACIIWMHGLGANAADMAALADYPLLANLPVRHVFVEAPRRCVTLNGGMPMQAWYDIIDTTLTGREDKQGITTSHEHILAIIHAQIASGFGSEQIILAGFSQGGAMALYTALHCELSLAGVVALSSYLPMASSCQPVLVKTTPMFLAFGQYDAIVLPEWTKKSEHYLLNYGYNRLTVRQYPIQHAICLEEIEDLAAWLSLSIKGVLAV